MSLFSELKRRNVLRVAAAYVALAWLVIQVTETLFPIFGLSETAMRGVVILLAIGFIPAVASAWAFELTPQGLIRDSEVDRSSPTIKAMGKRLDRLVIVALALALGYFALDKFLLDPARDEAREQAIAEAAGIDFIFASSKQGVSRIEAHMKLNYDASTAVSNIQAKVAGQPLDVALDTLGQFWFGEYRVLWKMPPHGSVFVVFRDREDLAPGEFPEVYWHSTLEDSAAVADLCAVLAAHPGRDGQPAVMQANYILASLDYAIDAPESLDRWSAHEFPDTPRGYDLARKHISTEVCQPLKGVVGEEDEVAIAFHKAQDWTVTKVEDYAGPARPRILRAERYHKPSWLYQSPPRDHSGH